MALSGYALPSGGIVFEPVPGAIPFTAIDRMARRLELAGRGFEIFALLIGRLDQVWRDWHAAARAAHARNRGAAI